MKKFSANYSYSNNNFVIQNLNGQRISNEYLSGICIIKNILQRGLPTIPSSYIQDNIGKIYKRDDYNNSYALIDKDTPIWKRIIRGNEKGNYYPAKKFYEEIIPKYLNDFLFIQKLIIPEMPINEITMSEVDEFANQQVDFYLPQAYLVIEIDGFQHEKNEEKDSLRNSHLKKYGIETVHIKVIDLEKENEIFTNKINEIKNIIEKAMLEQKKRQEKDKKFICLDDYKKAFNEEIDLSNPNYKATAIIRFQLLILELLENGLLDFNNNWKLEIFERDISDFEEIAIQDLFLWFENIYNLQKINFKKPEFNIKKIKSINDFTCKDTVKIDFSLLKRYTDECQAYSNIIFIRTDYLDEYKFFKKGNSRDKLKIMEFKNYDHFELSTANLVKYNLKFGGINSDEKYLSFFAWNIFFQTNESFNVTDFKFREGQIPIIANALARNDTIGLLPTGSGKSICYQLSVILQPAISFVVCPIKSLMYDQEIDLHNVYFSRINTITSENDEEEKRIIEEEFRKGKYFFVFISPERFQKKDFREYLTYVNKKFNIAYAVIDEAHCLSEWGHDFRISYLNLSNTIKKYCTNFKFLGLTATASIHVLKDLQLEFNIEQKNIKTPIDYTRKELKFIVLNDEGNKQKAIEKELKNLEKNNFFKNDNNDSKCGIIFTPSVNGKSGCYKLYNELKTYFNDRINYYSGSIPEINKQKIMSDNEFDEYKKNVQDDFKKNKVVLLTATKAFGMGVNKGNIYCTFHYGIPSSMESLYQEAGRAGRDKIKFSNQKAQCYIFLSKTTNNELLSELWERKTTLDEIKNLNIDGDISTNTFLFSSSMDNIKDEFELIKKIYSKYSIPNAKNVNIKNIGTSKLKNEKAIYKLKQLGVVEDWTIKDFFGTGSFEVDFNKFNLEIIRNSLTNTIKKYNKDFSIEMIENDINYSHYKNIFNQSYCKSEIDKYILILLQWGYDNFAYNRRQSLKNVYEICCKVSNGEISDEEFKTHLENYFKFTESSYILQHIAENPNNFEKWFEVFYKNQSLINKVEQESLKDNLSRFLESYMFNVGLDLISGLIRLFLNEYDNSDGRNRLESSFKEIINYKPQDIDVIINYILKIGKELDDKNKSNLAETIYTFFNNKEILLKMAEEWQDCFSTTTLIRNYNQRLEIIKRRIAI